jgi:SAM-dependent methyltransferase
MHLKQEIQKQLKMNLLLKKYITSPFLFASRIYILILISVFVLPLQSCKGQEEKSNDAESNEKYTFKRGNPNGIGKWYQGREIAHVMGFQGMEWLNRPEREQEENVSLLLKNMEIESSDVIADIGAGSGYHVFKMAEIAEQGKIYGVDIQDEMLAEMQDQKDLKGINNVVLVKGSEKSVNLPKNSIDKVLMVDVYHEFSFPLEMLLSIKKALKPNGKIFLIEYRGEDNNIPIKTIHKMTESQAVEELETAGFRLLQNVENLPWQHCMVFVIENN